MDAEKAVNRLAKWRTIFAGWQLGTRAKGDPESDAVRDHREATLLLRADLSALTMLLAKKGIFTRDEYAAQLVEECDALEKALEARFPGVVATDEGLSIDVAKAATWMSRFKP